MQIDRNMPYIFSAVSGLVTGIAFLHPSMWVLCILGPLFFLLILSNQLHKTGEAFLQGVVFGTVYLGAVFVWMWQALPLDWLLDTSWLIGTFSVFVGWFLSSTVLGLSFGFFAVGAQYLIRTSPYGLLGVPLIWILCEYLRAWLFSILFLGSGSLLGAHFSIGFIGYPLAHVDALVPFARIGGVYGLSFAALFLAVAFFAIYTQPWSFRKQLRYMIGVFIGVVGLGGVIGMSITPTLQNVSIAVIHTNFPTKAHLTEEEANIRMETLHTLMRGLVEKETLPDVIVFPEDSRFLGSLYRQKQLEEYTDVVLEGRETLIIDSSRLDDETNYARSKIFYYNTGAKDLTLSEKRFLVPGGEYIPYFYRLFLRATGNSDALSAFDQARSYESGEETKVVSVDGLTIGALFCSEIVSPNLYQNLYKNYKPDVLVNVASHGYFHGSNVLYEQILAIAKAHAVQNNTPFIQASNVAPSFVINARGRVIVESSWENNETLELKI